MAKNPLRITDTILRDAHQSQAATRMRTDEMLPACEMLDKVGYYSLECWGGATYDACLRFLNEDPWERLRKLRKALPNTKLQMLLRGQNLLGYRPYADDVVDFFVKKAVENGIDIIRCFDALNDLRNMQTAVKATKKYGGTAEIAMSYTESPVHNEDYFVKLAVDIQKMGADVICIKDMANLLLPYNAYSLVKRLKKETSLPTDTITRKEIDLRGARTSAGEFPEALELIATKKVDMLKLLTKTVKLEEVPETIIDIEKNPGSYMKVVVTME